MRASWFVRALLTLGFVSTALHGLRPMVSYRALELGATATEIGLVTASFGLLSFILAIPTGRWIDRLGETRFIIAGAGLMAVMSVALFTSSSVLTVGLAQAGLGAGNILSLVALQSLVATYGPTENRDALFGTLSVMGSLGQVFGPLVAGAVASAPGGSTRQVFLVSCALVSVGALIGMSFVRWPPAATAASVGRTGQHGAVLPSLSKVLTTQSMPQAMLASITVLVTVDLLVAYLPVYGEARGISVGAVSFLLAARAATAALSRLVMARLIRSVGRHRLFVMCLAIPAAAVLVLPLTSDVMILTVLMGVAGFGLGLGQPLSLAWIAAAAPREVRGMALGVRLTGNRFGQVVLPAALGLVSGATSVPVMFALLAALLGGSAGTLMTADFDVDHVPTST